MISENKTQHKIVSILDWAKSNNYSISRSEWPKYLQFNYNRYILNQNLIDYVSARDQFHYQEGSVIVEATDVSILQIVLPSGARRYELMARNGSLLCDPFSSIWYQYLANKFSYGSLNNNRISLNTKDLYKKCFQISDIYSYVIGHDNHGHWLFDFYPIALNASDSMPCPILIRELDAFKIETLIHRRIEYKTIPDSFSENAVFFCKKLYVYSSPPPRLIPAAIRSAMSNDVVERSGVVFLHKQRGTIRLDNFLQIRTALEGLKVKFVDPTALSLHDSLLLFNSSTGIIAPMGAESCNFLLTNTPFLALVPSRMKNTVDQSELLLQSCLAVDDVNLVYCPESSQHVSLHNSSFTLDQDSLAKVIRFINSNI